MKLLLDECLPEELKDFISGHEVFSTGEMSWKGKRNGELMRSAVESGFDVFLTSDKNLPYQQNISKYQLAVIVFDVYQNTLPELKKRIPRLYELLREVKKANFYIC